jgi:phosphoglycolate phosphatase
VHGVDVADIRTVEYAGRTDHAIARDLLAAAGVPAEQFDARWPELCEAAAEIYERLVPDDLSAFVAPGMVDLLTELSARPDHFRLSLVTGNLQPVARLKLTAAGVCHFFEDGQGGFGSDSEFRGELPAIARARALDPAVAARADRRDRRHAA